MKRNCKLKVSFSEIDLSGLSREPEEEKTQLFCNGEFEYDREKGEYTVSYRQNNDEYSYNDVVLKLKDDFSYAAVSTTGEIVGKMAFSGDHKRIYSKYNFGPGLTQSYVTTTRMLGGELDFTRGGEIYIDYLLENKTVNTNVRRIVEYSVQPEK